MMKAIDGGKGKKFLVAGVLALITGVILLIVGAVTYSKSCKTEAETITGNKACLLSEEAKRSGLVDFIKKVQKTYYSLNPNNLAYNPDVDIEDRIHEFSPYDCKPESIKKRTDKARDLLQEIKKKNIKTPKLKPRENKALQQVLHYLANNFGQPYQENYYAGDWMMGPNGFCWMPICSVGSDLKYHFNTVKGSFQPRTYEDVQIIMSRLEKHKEAIYQYLENVKYGVKAGMVRAKEDCEAGLYALKRKYLSISQNGSLGILYSKYTVPMRSVAYLEKLKPGVNIKWIRDFGRTVNESIDRELITGIGEPMKELINYLENVYTKTHCVPSSISAGLANLPLDYVYYNGYPNLSESTTRKLPNGDSLNGPKAYEEIVPYFTTNDMTPDQIHQLGWKMLKTLYPQAVEIAKKIENETDEEKAITKFKVSLVADNQWFNDPVDIPQNESNEEGFNKCVDMKSAEQFCPVRYKGMIKWINYVQGILSKLHYRTTHMFYHTGPKVTAPNCPLKIIPKFLPGSGSQSFRNSGPNCKTPANYLLPFFLGKLGPVHNAYSVAAHEGRPGHHTQTRTYPYPNPISVIQYPIQPGLKIPSGYLKKTKGGLLKMGTMTCCGDPLFEALAIFAETGNQEYFLDSCGGPIRWLNSETYYTAFTEGWALYSENPLMALETDIYKDNLLQKYGMLKWQIWRALRLIIDTGLHHKGMNRTEALRLFEEYAWDKTDKAVKDVTRYQSNPGQATAYMIGQLAIWQIRNETEAALGGKFDEKEFHYQVLSQGSSPLSFLKDHMQKYIACVKNKESDGCEFFIGSDNDKLSAESKISSSQIATEVFKEQHFHEHYD